MPLSKKHMRLVAHTINKIEDPNVKELEIAKWVQTFEDENPRFDKELFKRVCNN